MRTLVALLAFAGPAVAQPVAPIARLGSTALRHPDRPLCLAFTADGSGVASGGADGTLRLWDVRTGAELKRFAVARGSVVSVATSTGGIAAHFADEKVRLFDPKSLAVQATFASPNLDALALTADGGLVAGVGWGNQVFLRDSATGQDRLDLPPGRAVALSADGKRVAVADGTESVSVFDGLSGQPLAKLAHPCRDAVTALAFDRTAGRIAVADSGPTGRVRVWDIGTATQLGEWVGEGPLSFAEGGKIVGRRNGAVAVWRVGSKQPVQVFAGGVNVVAVSANGKFAATAGDGARIAVWNLATGDELRPQEDGFGTVVGLLPGSEKTDITIIGSRSLVRWRPGQKPEPMIRLLNDATTAVADKSGAVVAAGPDAVVRLKNLVPSSFTLPKTGIGVPTATALDGDRAAVGTDDKRLILFDANSGSVRGEHPTPGVPLGLAFVPGTSRLAVLGRDGFARMWDTTGKELVEVWKARVPRSLRGGIAVSPDGASVVVTSVVRAEVYDTGTGQRQFSLERKWEDGPFQSVAFSPNGQLLAIGATGGNGTLTVWEVTSRNPVLRVPSDSGSVTRVQFLADGRQLATAGSDDTVAVWPITPQRKAQPTAADRKSAWANLARQDAATGVAAVGTLIDAGKEGVATVGEGIREQGKTAAAIRQLVTDLGDPRFVVRERASRTLQGYGLLALPAVSAATADTNLEIRTRAEAVIRAMRAAGDTLPDHDGYGEVLRLVRSVWVLEQVGGPDAEAVLVTLAARTDRVGKAASAAIERMRVK